MTFPYPSEPAPDGAYVMGGRYGQDVTESTVTQIVRGGALTNDDRRAYDRTWTRRIAA